MKVEIDPNINKDIILERVLILSTEFPPGPGGIGNHGDGLARFLVKNGYRVTVFAASRPEYDEKGHDDNAPFRVFRYHANKSFYYKLFASISFIISNRGNFDCVILSGLNPLFLTIPIRLLSKASVLSIIHGHEILMVSKFLRWILKLNLRFSKGIVAVSRFSKEILNAFGIERGVNVISNGVNTNVIANRHYSENNEPNKLSLVTVGSLTQRKGQHNVVRAIPSLLKCFKEVHYHIIGMPTDHKRIHELANTLGVSDHIHVHGALDEELKNQILHKSDLFVLLSENLPNGDVEGFGIAILEANLLGIPAIGSKGTGVEQAIQDGVSGVLINGRSDDELVEAVLRIMSNYSVFSNNAKLWAKVHDWDTIGKEYIGIMKNI